MKGLFLCLLVIVSVTAVRSLGYPPPGPSYNPDYGLPSGVDISDIHTFKRPTSEYIGADFQEELRDNDAAAHYAPALAPNPDLTAVYAPAPYPALASAPNALSAPALGPALAPAPASVPAPAPVPAQTANLAPANAQVIYVREIDCDDKCQYYPKIPVCTIYGRDYDNDCHRKCRSNEPLRCRHSCPCPYIPQSHVASAPALEYVPAPAPVHAPVVAARPHARFCEYCIHEEFEPVCVDNRDTLPNECFAFCERRTITCKRQCPCY